MPAITAWPSTLMERSDETTPRTSNISGMITSYSDPSGGCDTLIWPRTEKKIESERDVTVVDVIIRSCRPMMPSDKYNHFGWRTNSVREQRDSLKACFILLSCIVNSNRDSGADVVARSCRVKCQPTQQVMRFDIWHQGVIRPAPAAEWRLLLLGGRAELSEGMGRLAAHVLFVRLNTHTHRQDWLKDTRLNVKALKRTKTSKLANQILSTVDSGLKSLDRF